MENYGEVDGELWRSRWRSRWRTMENHGYTMGYPKRSPRISLKISLNIRKSSPRFSELTDILGDPRRHQDILGYLCGANSQMSIYTFISCGKQRLGGLSCEETALRVDAALQEQNQRGAETRWRHEADQT
jgi:hypothetical protein